MSDMDNSQFYYTLFLHIDNKWKKYGKIEELMEKNIFLNDIFMLQM